MSDELRAMATLVAHGLDEHPEHWSQEDCAAAILVCHAYLAEHPERPARDGEGWCPVCLMNCFTLYGESRCCGAKAETKRNG